MNCAYSMDFLGFFKDLFSSRAGGKAVVTEEGKDIEKFTSPKKCPNRYPWGEPQIKDQQILKRTLYICRMSYSLEYDPLLKMPLAVSEVLEKNNVLYSKLPTSSAFQADPDLPSKIQASLNDYLQTSYEKTPLAAPVNMSIYNEEWSDEELAKRNKISLDQSYFLSDVVPMNSQMKREIWTPLEAQIRYWGSQKDRLFVITGPVFINGQTQGTLGSGKISIPTHFYKIVTDPLTYGSVAYIVPNGPVPNGYNYNNFVVPIKEVERVTGLYFFPNLAPYYSVQVKQDVMEMYKYKRKN